MELTPCIAVMPLAASGGDGEAAVVADVLVDSLITALARRPELRVLSRLSSAALAGRGDVPAEFLRGLGASFALAGTCRLMGSRVVASFELLDLRDAGVLWAEQGRATVDEVLQPDCELIERVANEAARAVIQLDAFVAATMPLPSLASHALQWGAVTLMHRSPRPEFERVREMLEQLIDRHGRIAAPRAWLAKWHVLRLTRGLVDDPERTAREAVDLARRAVASDPGCALALAVEGFVHCHLRRDLEAAAACLDQAIAGCPNESLAWLFRGVVHAFSDEGKAGVRCTERALQLSPIDPLKYYFESLAAAAAVAAGWNARAIELAQHSLRRNVMHTSTYRTLAIAQVMDGRGDEARQTMRRLMALEPGFTVARFLARVPSGDREISRRFAHALREAGAP
jgi:TolB-like protein